MSELIILITITVLKLDKELRSKNITGIVVAALCLVLWSMHSNNPYGYPAIILTVLMLINRFFNSEHTLINLQTIGIVSIITLATVNWSIPIIALCYLIGVIEEKNTGKLKQALLLFVSILALNATVPYGHVAFAISIFSIIFLINGVWREKYNEGLIWISVLCVNLIVSSYHFHLLALSVCALLASVFCIGIWVSDRERQCWQRLLQVFCIIIAASSISFGIMGFWAGTIAIVALVTLLGSDANENEIIKLPYPAMSTFILLPIGPLMFLLVNGKLGVELALGLVIAFSAAVSSWRWISQLEKRLSDISIGYLRLTYAIVLLSFMAIGSLYFLAENKVGLVSYLAMAFVILVLFSVMRADSKILSLGARKVLDLRLNQIKMTSRDEQAICIRSNLSGVITNTVRAGWIMAEEVLNYSAKIYPVIALIAIIGVIAAGILDG